jgi:tetratricopeptide (TPR) repeat protein
MNVALAAVLAVMMCGGCRRGSGTVVIQDPGPGQRNEALRLVEEAIKAEKKGEDAKAIRLYEQSISHSEEFGIAWHNLGMLYFKRGEVGDRMKAVEFLHHAISLQPEQPWSYYCVGMIYADNVQYDKAMEYFKKALEKDKHDLHALRGVAKAGKKLFVADRESLDFMKTALLIESDPTWRRIFEEEMMRIQGALQGAGSAGRF